MAGVFLCPPQGSFEKKDVSLQSPLCTIKLVLKWKPNRNVIPLACKASRLFDANDYPLPFAAAERKLFKVGINFSSDINSVTEWEMA